MIKRIILVAQFVAFSLWIIYLSSLEHPLEFLDGFNIWDKLIHTVGFFAYSVSVLLGAKALFASKNRKYILAATLLFFTLFAASDEIHQSFVPGRSCDFFDFLADVIGGSLGVFLGGRFLIKGQK